jgi:glycosyltransferase involved in cell wall biosynthesis
MLKVMIAMVARWLCGPTPEWFPSDDSEGVPSASAEPQLLIATLLHSHGPTGVQTHFNTLVRYAKESGGKANIVTPFDAPALFVFPIFAVRKLLDRVSGTASVWWYRHWHELFLKLALSRELKHHNHAIVYAQCPLSARAALVSRVSRAQRVVMVAHFNLSQADEWVEKGKIASDGGLARKIRKEEEDVLPRLDGIVHVSSFMRCLLENRIPALAHLPKATIPNFCDPVSTQAPIALEDVDLINIGTLEPRKNQQFLIQVLAEAARKGSRYTLALVGDGPDRGALQILAQQMGVSRQVRFLGYQRNAAQLLKSAKIYVHSATIDNSPIVLLEAMAAGLPVLASAVGGIPEILEDERQGFFWPDDKVAAADLLIRLIEDKALHSKFATQARLRYESKFRTDRVAERLLTFLLNV